MKLVAETHLFGSVDGYRTLAVSAGIAREDLSPLEAMGFGQPSAKSVHRLLDEPVILVQPIGRRWMAVTRALPGPTDTAGRETLQRLSLLFRHREYRTIVRGDLRGLLNSRRLWDPANFTRGHRIHIPLAGDPSSPVIPTDAALRALQAWALSRRSGSMSVFPLGSESAILDLLRSLHENDLALFRWGLRLLSSGALADVATLLIDDSQATRKPVQRVSLSDAIDIPSIRRFDGIAKPLPAIFGHESPEEDAVPVGPVELRRRGSRIAVLLAAGLGLMGGLMYLAWPRPVPPTVTASPEPAVEPETVPMDGPGTTPDADGPTGPTPDEEGPDSTSDEDRSNGKPSKDEGDGPGGTGADQNESGTPVPEPDPPEPSGLTVPEIQEILNKYRGGLVPDHLLSKPDFHLEELVRSFESLAKADPNGKTRLDDLPSDRHLLDTGVIPNSYESALDEARDLFETLMLLKEAGRTIDRSGLGQTAFADRESLVRRLVGAVSADAASDEGTSDRPAARWRQAMDGADRWIEMRAREVQSRVFRILTETADAIRRPTIKDISGAEVESRDTAIESFVEEAKGIRRDFEIPGDFRTIGPATDLGSAVEAMQAGQKRVSDRIGRAGDPADPAGQAEFEEDLVDLIDGVRRVIEFIPFELRVFRRRIDGTISRLGAMNPKELFDDAGQSEITALRDELKPSLKSTGSALARANAACGVISRAGKAAAKANQTQDSRDQEANDTQPSRVQEAIDRLDSAITFLRDQHRPKTYASRRTARPLEDLVLMKQDLDMVARRIPEAIRDQIAGFSQRSWEVVTSIPDKDLYAREIQRLQQTIRACTQELGKVVE